MMRTLLDENPHVAVLARRVDALSRAVTQLEAENRAMRAKRTLAFVFAGLAAFAPIFFTVMLFSGTVSPRFDFVHSKTMSARSMSIEGGSGDPSIALGVANHGASIVLSADDATAILKVSKSDATVGVATSMATAGLGADLQSEVYAEAADVRAQLATHSDVDNEYARLELEADKGTAALSARRRSTDNEMHAELALDRPELKANRAHAGFGLLPNGPRLYMTGVDKGIWGEADLSALDATPTLSLKRADGESHKRASALTLIAPPEKQPGMTATVEKVPVWSMPSH